MQTLKLKTTVQQNTITIELNADRFEKLANDFGFFNPAFLNSIDRAESDCSSKRVRKITSLKDLR